MRTLTNALLTGSLAIPLSCAQRPSVDGTWILWSIDGVSVSEAPPDRTALPAGVYFGAPLSDGDISQEYKVHSVTVEILPDRTFRETRVEATTLVLVPSAVRAITGMTWPGTQPFRQPQGVDTTHSLGKWRFEHDSLLLFRSKEDVQAAVIALFRRSFPTLSEAQVKSMIDQSLDELTDQLQYSGRVEPDRLSLRDKNGRTVVFRRTLP